MVAHSRSSFDGGTGSSVSSVNADQLSLAGSGISGISGISAGYDQYQFSKSSDVFLDNPESADLPVLPISHRLDNPQQQPPTMGERISRFISRNLRPARCQRDTEQPEDMTSSNLDRRELEKVLISNSGYCSSVQIENLSSNSSVSLELSIPLEVDDKASASLRTVLYKDTSVPFNNCLESVVRSSATQTESVKQQNFPPPIVSSSWQIRAMIPEEGDELALPSSGVILDVPAFACSKSAEVCMAVCANIDRIASKLELLDNEVIISPCAEFCASIDVKFTQKCRITLLQTLPCEYELEHVKVYCATSRPNGKVELKALGRDDYHGNAWFTVTRERTLVVFTDHFSGYVCTYCGVQEPRSLTLLVSGIHKQALGGHHWANVFVYTWDSRLQNADFQQEYISRSEDRVCTKTLDLLEEDLRNSRLHYRLRIIGQCGQNWFHSKDEDGENGLPVVQTLDMKDLLCCKNRKCKGWKTISQPSSVSWVLQTSETCDPDRVLQCVVDVCQLPKEQQPTWKDVESREKVTRLIVKVEEKKDSPKSHEETYLQIEEQLMQKPIEDLEDIAKQQGLSQDDLRRVKRYDGSYQQNLVKKCMAEIKCNTQKTGSVSTFSTRYSRLEKDNTSCRAKNNESRNQGIKDADTVHSKPPRLDTPMILGERVTVESTLESQSDNFNFHDEFESSDDSHNATLSKEVFTRNWLEQQKTRGASLHSETTSEGEDDFNKMRVGTESRSVSSRKHSGARDMVLNNGPDNRQANPRNQERAVQEPKTRQKGKQPKKKSVKSCVVM